MVPSGWEKLQISDICKLQNGNSFKPAQWDTKGLPIIRIQNLNGSENFHYYSGEVNEKWLVETGQLLFSWAGTRGVSFGPFVWEKQRGVLNQHIYKVYANEFVCQEWLYKALSWVTSKIEGQAHGFKATLLHVQKKDIDNQPILVPPLSEQRKIAKILCTWDKAISSTERLINNSKQQKKALMQQLLTGKKRLLDDSGKPFVGEWGTVILGALTSRITKGTTPSTNGYNFQKQGINFVKVESVTKTGHFIRSKFAYIDNECHASFKRSQLEKNDILFSIAGALGRVAIVGEDILPANTNQALAIVRLKEKIIDYKFLFFYLGSQLVISKVIALTAQAAQPNLSLKDIGNLPILKPPIKEQEKIAAVLTNADKEIDLLEQQLSDLKQEKKALMQQLLTGKRRVKVDNIEAA